MLTGPLLRVMAIASVSLSLLAGGGCAMLSPSGERLVSTGITPSPDAPPWVTDGAGRVQADGDLVFVGRGLGENVLDERGAYNAARDHAAAQLARMVISEVHSRSGYTERRRGPGFFPARQQLHSDDFRTIDETMLHTDAMVHRLRERDLYWERWLVRRAGDQYKCWVLMTISERDFDELVEQNLARLDADGPRRAELPPQNERSTAQFTIVAH